MADNSEKWNREAKRFKQYIRLEKGLSENTVEAYMHDLEHRAVSVLGRRVRILKTSKKKVVELAYSDDDDLEALLKSICGGDFFADND